MAATSHTGIAGSTVWCTDAAWSRVRQRASQLPKRGGRGAGGQVSAAIEHMLRAYQDHVSGLRPERRPCFVGTLIGYPGASYSGSWVVDRDKPGKNKIRRVDEVRQDGSRRAHLGPSTRTLLAELVPFGLVLAHQRVQTRPTGLAAHPSDDGRNSRVVRTARPLSDVVLTAIILETGALPDGPLQFIERQLLRQETAQQLWTLAERQCRDVGETQTVLQAALPRLLTSDEQRISVLRELLTGWAGSLDELITEIAQRAPSTATHQASLFSDQVPV